MFILSQLLVNEQSKFEPFKSEPRFPSWISNFSCPDVPSLSARIPDSSPWMVLFFLNSRVTLSLSLSLSRARAVAEECCVALGMHVFVDPWARYLGNTSATRKIPLSTAGRGLEFFRGNHSLQASTRFVSHRILPGRKNEISPGYLLAVAPPRSAALRNGFPRIFRGFSLSTSFKSLLRSRCESRR